MVLLQVFFCKYNDPIYVKMEKLEIMIKLASDRNIDQVILTTLLSSAVCPSYFVLVHIMMVSRPFQCRFFWSSKNMPRK